jgi:hypothetical protein
MDYELISERDYYGLPEDPLEKWVEIEKICRRNLDRLLENSRIKVPAAHLMREYMTVVSVAAHELGVEGVEYPRGLFSDEAFHGFLRTTAGTSARIRLKKATKRSALSVALRPYTVDGLRKEFDRFRSIILEADVAAEKRQKLLDGIDGLTRMLEEPRFSLGRAFATLAWISVALAGTTSFLADGPDAIKTITLLVGSELEDDSSVLRLLEKGAELRRLPAPPKQIEDLNRSDDEIPF